MLIGNARKKAGIAAAVILFGIMGLTAGCGTTAQKSNAVSVKTMKVLQQDVSVSYDYSGEVQSTDAVAIKPRVSGSIVEKYFTSGQAVQKGQPLYKIDDRQYSSQVLSARSNVDKARTAYNNSLIDLQRYEKLEASGAIAEQTLTTQRATVETNRSEYEDMQALLQEAEENLDDTVVRSPMSGKLSVDDVAAGTYVTSGSTQLVSVGTINPVYVSFSVSENEFLNFRENGRKPKESDAASSEFVPPTATLTLSNGSKYAETSTTYIADRQLNQSTGTLTVKALFNNDNHLLLPGMFAKITIEGQPQKDALLVPQRAVQQVLNKSFVIVVGPDNKSVSKIVELGDEVGSYYVVKSGLTKDDNVVVEGLTNLKEGQALNPTETNAQELGLSLTTSTTPSYAVTSQQS
ncbi:efflux RND transporter periplasmic adaptor subunit [Dialister hominis]|uniref:efflux RND transporter periplasmic adaptor subunit n=2 Tax=Dialister TaxID=39948 RepID=UPI003078C7AF